MDALGIVHMEVDYEKNELFSIGEDMLRQDEIELITEYLDWLHAKYPGALIRSAALDLINAIRQNAPEPNPVELLMAEYSMSHEEGLLLMSLSEALLRTEHAGTRDALIADKLTQGQWSKRRKLFQSWSAYLLEKSLLSSKWLLSGLGSWVAMVSAKGISASMQRVMRSLAEHFVFSETIDNAIERADVELNKGYRYSFDLLGEASLTAQDADGFIKGYHDALNQMASVDPEKRAKMSLSIKLSSFYPRFEPLHGKQAEENLLESLLPLIEKAKSIQVPITIDAEEVYRLNMMLRVMQKLIMHPITEGYDGLGCAVQAYTKVALQVIEQLAQLAREHNRRICIRLVKGAYWDTEIKDAQVGGFSDYPVFTRKEYTDVSYLRCVYSLHDHVDVIYAQFGTHNANTVMAVRKIMGFGVPYEFQCLHGMGYGLYQYLMIETGGAIKCRIYAPVGNYQELLPYLVRRLLENGANSSFVNHLHDMQISSEHLAADVTVKARQLLNKKGLIKPSQLLLPRINSSSVDWSDHAAVEAMLQTIADQRRAWAQGSTGDSPVFSPNNGLYISSIHKHESNDIPSMMKNAQLAFKKWSKVDVMDRSACLETAALVLERSKMAWASRLVIEAGKTWQDAISEVREAVDFIRYYAIEARNGLVDVLLPGPTGESNRLSYHGRGVWFCISPWNFPLAIFVGQIAAALVSGNTVIAKGSSHVMLISRDMIELFHQSGIPKDVLQGLFAGSAVAKEVFQANELAGVVMTGGNDSAFWIRNTLAARTGPMIPFIAETGGQNVLISDPSAHPDQLLKDVVTSAFQSAGQRCSALRVWYCHDAVFDVLVQRLCDMMKLLQVGSPESPETDVGPLINKENKEGLLEHVKWCNKYARLLGQAPIADNLGEAYFAPIAYEIKSMRQLKKEWFGPILHVIRYKDEDVASIISEIRESGYGLTMGIHSRIDRFVREMIDQSMIGNFYVNRNMIGATVGVQPFGGVGLSGTGPKAGGPHYLHRFVRERVVTVNTAAVGGNASLFNELYE